METGAASLDDGAVVVTVVEVTAGAALEAGAVVVTVVEVTAGAAALELAGTTGAGAAEPEEVCESLVLTSKVVVVMRKSGVEVIVREG